MSDKSSKKYLRSEQSISRKAALRSLRKQRHMVEVMTKPIIPRLCKYFYIGIIVFPALFFIIDIVGYFRFYRSSGIAVGFTNAIQSTFFMWCVIGVILLVLSAVQLIRISRGYTEYDYVFNRDPNDKYDTGVDIPGIEQEQINFDDDSYITMHPVEPSVPPERKYKKYLTVSIVGGLILGLLFILTK